MLHHPRPNAFGLVILASVALLVGLAAPATAAQRTVTLDPAKTDVTFTLDSTLHEVEGSLELVRGKVTYDPESGAAAGSIVLDAKSAETGNGMRDKKMHGTVLESDEFSTIELTVESVEGTLPASGSGTMTVVGTLLLHGDRHPVRLPVTIEPAGSGTVKARTQLTVPFVKWGLEDPSGALLKVDKEVQVSIETVGKVSG